MPNHCENILTISGKQEEIERCRTFIKGEEEDQFIDFNKIIPMPKELVGTRSPMKIIPKKEYDKQEARIAESKLTDIEKSFGVSRCLTKKLSNEYTAKFGADNWYDWSVMNWGTKWNAYSQNELAPNQIQFDTAWGSPEPLIAKLSTLFPELTFEVEYDIEGGNGNGSYEFINGK